MSRRGFSLIESMIGLCLTLAILAASLEFFGLGRRVFFKLKAAEEERLAVMAALEKIRGDAARAGAGLQAPIRLGLLRGIELQDSVLSLQCEERSLAPTQDLAAGDTVIQCQGTEDLAKGRTICIHDAEKGELLSLADSGRGFVLCAEPLQQSYKKDEAQVLIIGSVSYFLQAGVIRRRANASPAQPLLEEVGLWSIEADEDFRLITIGLQLKGKERRHEISLLAKNMALALGPE
jgi:hypothetical protein